MNSLIKNAESNKEHKLFQRYFNKAFHYQSQNNMKLAIEMYDKALCHNNKHLPTLQVIGYLLQQSGQYEKALAYYTRATALHSQSATLQNAVGICFEHCQNWQSAKTHFLNAIELRQDYAEALNNLGNICRKMGDYQQAEFNLLRSLRLRINVPTLINLGLLMAEMHNYSQAHSFYDHALRLQPFNNQIKWHKALLLLSEGEFKQGWELYTVNSQTSNNIHQFAPVDVSNPQTQREVFFQNNIYIKGKQSINDEIMFASCLPEILSQAKSCYIECDDRLLPLFQRSFQDATIISKSEFSFESEHTMPKDINYTTSLVNCARHLRQSFSDFPEYNQFLKASETNTQHWRHRYSTIGNSLKVGIAWRSSNSEDSVTHQGLLRNWEAIFNETNCHLINLQYGQVNAELEQFSLPIKQWSDCDYQYNIDQLASQITALDLVITTNNLVAHLAGALGKSVWILLPYATNWRWFNGRNPCPWYASAKVFKQNSPDDWASLYQEINAELKDLCEKNGSTYTQLLSVS